MHGFSRYIKPPDFNRSKGKSLFFIGIERRKKCRLPKVWNFVCTARSLERFLRDIYLENRRNSGIRNSNDVTKLYYCPYAGKIEWFILQPGFREDDLAINQSNKKY